MALAPCPECEKKISTKAERCPKCGHPIDEDVHAKWKADAVGKQIGCGILLLVFLGFVVYGWFQDIMAGPSGDVKKTVLAVLPGDHPYIESWAGDDLYGGTAVLINDKVGFWVKEGTVYATNGLAHTWAFSLDYAPASVDQAIIEKAVKGEAPDMVPALDINYLQFIETVAQKIEPTVVGRKSLTSYVIDKRVHINLKEVGGQLESAYFGFYAKEGKNQLPFRAVHAAYMTIFPEVSSNEAGTVLNDLITAASKERGTIYASTRNGIALDLHIGEKQDMNFTFRPETE